MTLLIERPIDISFLKTHTDATHHSNVHAFGERAKTIAEVAKRGLPMATVETALLDFEPAIPSERLWQNIMDRKTVLSSLAPLTLATYGYDGSIHPVTTLTTDTGYQKKFGTNGSALELGKANMVGGKLSSLELHTTNAENIRGVYAAVKSPYVDSNSGGFHIMSMDLSTDELDPPARLIDIKRPLLESKLKTEAEITKALVNQFGRAVWANNVSPYSLEGRNAQSVLWQHNHMFSLPDISPDEAKIYRDHADHEDFGLSEYFGMVMAPQIEEGIPAEYRGNAPVLKDQKGFTLQLKNFSPDRMAEPEFIDNLLMPLYNTINDFVSQTHDQLYESSYDDVANMVNAFKTKGSITEEDKARYTALFTLKPEDPRAPAHIQTLRRLHESRLLKQPMGIVIGIAFTDQGEAMLAVSPVFRKDKPSGPGELWGLQVIRNLQTPAASSEEEAQALAEQRKAHTARYHEFANRVIIGSAKAAVQ